MKNNSFQYTGQVLSDWIYENGHMNVKSYVGLFESVMWSKWKISSENSDPMTLPGLVTGRFYVEPRQGLFESDQWGVRR